MTILILQNSRYRADAAEGVRAEMERQRLAAYARAAGTSRSVRLYVISQAKAAMVDYQAVKDYPANFCLIVSDQYLAVGDLSNAYNYYDRLCSSSKYRHFAWRGYLGRGRVQERRRKYNTAVSDYQAGLARTTDWWSAYACAQAITDLCVRSGKHNRPDEATRAIRLLLKRIDGTNVTQRRNAARALLKKNPAK